MDIRYFLFLTVLVFNNIINKHAEAKCLMYGQCNKEANILGEVFQNCYTPNVDPQRMSESTTEDVTQALADLNDLCPELFAEGESGEFLRMQMNDLIKMNNILKIHYYAVT